MNKIPSILLILQTNGNGWRVSSYSTQIVTWIPDERMTSCQGRLSRGGGLWVNQIVKDKWDSLVEKDKPWDPSWRRSSHQSICREWECGILKLKAGFQFRVFLYRDDILNQREMERCNNNNNSNSFKQHSECNAKGRLALQRTVGVF